MPTAAPHPDDHRADASAHPMAERGADATAAWQARRNEAHAEAERLRREAMADFWRGADAQVATAATQAVRAAERLAQRLVRRRALVRP